MIFFFVVVQTNDKFDKVGRKSKKHLKHKGEYNKDVIHLQ